MAKPKTKPERRVVVSARCKVATSDEISRLALRGDETVSEHAAKVLEAYAAGMFFCRPCQMPHPIEHKEHKERRA